MGKARDQRSTACGVNPPTAPCLRIKPKRFTAGQMGHLVPACLSGHNPHSALCTHSPSPSSFLCLCSCCPPPGWELFSLITWLTLHSSAESEPMSHCSRPGNTPCPLPGLVCVPAGRVGGTTLHTCRVLGSLPLPTCTTLTDDNCVAFCSPIPRAVLSTGTAWVNE